MCGLVFGCLYKVFYFKVWGILEKDFFLFWCCEIVFFSFGFVGYWKLL